MPIKVVRKREKCPVCRGMGVFWVAPQILEDGTHLPTTKEDCLACDGTGKVWMEKTVWTLWPVREDNE